MTDAEAPELTICSVYHSSSNKAFLELNSAFTQALNPEISLVWLAADNRSESDGTHLDPASFREIPGVPFPMDVANGMRGSFHHALALNKLRNKVQTRFALILDCDCYLIRPYWIRDVLEHMKKNDLAFFGIPWHPRWWNKVRYTLAPHALFIDTGRMPLSQLDFMPGPNARTSRLLASIDTLPLGPLWKKIWTGRLGIGQSRDVGYPIVRDFLLSGKADFEYALPGFIPSRDLPGSLAGRFLDTLLPDSLSYLPKRSSYVKKDFSMVGATSPARELGAEEFFWKGKPFAFHLRGYQSRIGYSNTDFERQYRTLKKTLATFATKIKSGRKI